MPYILLDLGFPRVCWWGLLVRNVPACQLSVHYLLKSWNSVLLPFIGYYPGGVRYRTQGFLATTILYPEDWDKKLFPYFFFFFFLRHYYFKEVLAFSTNSFHLGRFIMQSFQSVILMIATPLFTSSSHLCLGFPFDLVDMGVHSYMFPYTDK